MIWFRIRHFYGCMKGKNGRPHWEMVGIWLFCDNLFIKNIAKIRLPLVISVHYF